MKLTSFQSIGMSGRLKNRFHGDVVEGRKSVRGIIKVKTVAELCCWRASVDIKGKNAVK